MMSTDLERSFYNGQTCRREPLSDSECERIDRTLTLIPAGARSVLDIGCGDGRLTNRIKAPVVLCADFVDAGLCRVKAKAVMADVRDLPFDTRSFDVVVCTEVLEHMDDEGLRRAVVELERVAARWLVITTPHEEALFVSSTQCNACGCVYHISHHFQSFSARRLAALFRQFRLVRQDVFGRKTEYESVFWLWLIRRVGGKWPVAVSARCPHCGSAVCGSRRVNWVGWAAERLYWRVARMMGPPNKCYWMGLLLERQAEP